MQHESTRIYQKAIALVELSRDVLRALPRGHAHLADQLRRSVTSIPLTFAEGYAKRSAKDARRYFDYALGSANEVAATYDVAHAFGLVSAREHQQAKELCDHIARMLVRFRR